MTEVRASLPVVTRVLGHFPPFVGSRVINRGLRWSGIRVGRTANFWGPPTFRGDPRRYLRIGEACGFNIGCVFELEDEITVEDHVSVGHEVLFRGRRPIRVGAGAWLGARVIVEPGVTIGPGAVIGAGTIVREDVPANMMISGTRKISLAKWR